jgi:hypothetical protein
LGAAGVILVGWDLAYRRRKKDIEPIVIQARKPDIKLTENLPVDPNLQFGRLCVKKRPEYMHGGRYDRSFYYVEINTVPSTVASNCQGSITLDSNTYSTIWEKNESYNISIAHGELLYLFETSVFTSGSNQVTRLYFKWGIHTVGDEAIHDYNNNLDKQLTVLIQSDNATFPSEPESFKRTIRQIIHESIEC